jgi:hypothetical protein
VHEEHRDFTLSKDSFGHAAVQQVGKARAPVCGLDDAVRFEMPHLFDDVGSGTSVRNDRLDRHVLSELFGNDTYKNDATLPSARESNGIRAPPIPIRHAARQAYKTWRVLRPVRLKPHRPSSFAHNHSFHASMRLLLPADHASGMVLHYPLG